MHSRRGSLSKLVSRSPRLVLLVQRLVLRRSRLDLRTARRESETLSRRRIAPKIATATVSRFALRWLRSQRLIKGKAGPIQWREVEKLGLRDRARRQDLRLVRGSHSLVSLSEIFGAEINFVRNFGTKFFLRQLFLILLRIRDRLCHPILRLVLLYPRLDLQLRKRLGRRKLFEANCRRILFKSFEDFLNFMRGLGPDLSKLLNSLKIISPGGRLIF